MSKIPLPTLLSTPGAFLRQASPVTPAATVAALTRAISTARFATYLSHASGNSDRALALNAWNVRASGALWQILTHVEVTLRNAVSDALIRAFGQGWPYNNGFLFTFPNKEKKRFLKQRKKLEDKVQRKPVSTGDFVAGQTFVFWVSMLTARYDQRVWAKHFRTEFPSAPAGIGRQHVYAMAEDFRGIRNRIAHQEPILNQDLLASSRRGLALIRWSSPEMAAWVSAQLPTPAEFQRRP